MTDNELAKISVNDEAVFQRLYEDCSVALRRFALSLLNDEEAVLDIIQNVWMGIYDRQPEFDSESHFKVYLYRAVHNGIISHQRHKKVEWQWQQQYSEDMEIEQDVAHAIIEAEVFAAVNKVFAQLPPKCKQVYAQSLEGKTYREIAETFDISVNTVKKHIVYANRLMRERIKHVLSIVMFI